MNVAHRHLDVRVPRDSCECPDITAGLAQPSQESVANAIDFKGADLREFYRALVLPLESRPFTNREAIYSISEMGASELISKGECFVRTDQFNNCGHLNHSLDLNEIHLALKRTGMLVYWTPEMEIRS
jgi:hypothetical protein